jgi:hypothetical protein
MYNFVMRYLFVSVSSHAALLVQHANVLFERVSRVLLSLLQLVPLICVCADVCVAITRDST